MKEVIQLTVIDDRGATGTDTISIFNKKFSEMQTQVEQVNAVVNPTVTILSPANQATVNGVVNIDLTSNNLANLTAAYLYVDNNFVASDVAAPFAFLWDSRYVANGQHTIKVRAYFGGYQTFKDASITITTNNDTILTPTIAITSPATGATVSGTITITTDATAANFTYVYLYMDNVYKAFDSSAPFEFSFNTATLSNGQHTFKVYGYHSQARRFVENTVSVTVSN